MENWYQVINPLRWKRSFLISIVSVFLVLWFGFLDTYSIATRLRLASQRRDLTERTELLRQEISKLELEISRLERDPNVVERIAREKYGMRRKGETVYRIQEK